MVIKKPCAFPATAGDFNDHPLNTDRGSELHGTCFPGWHTEELVAPKRIFPANKCREHPIILYGRSTNTMSTNDSGTTIAFPRDYSKSGELHIPTANSSLSVWELTSPIGTCFLSGVPGSVQDDTMTRQSLKQEVKGTQAGYIIRFTCPSCHTENAIINKTPKDFYRKIRDARCHYCKKSSTVMTPGINQKP